MKSTTTIFDSYRPVQEYLSSPRLDRSPVTSQEANILSPIDAFLLNRIAEYYAQAPIVIDTAAPASAGTTSRFWSAQESVEKVIVPVEADSQATDLRSFIHDSTASATTSLPSDRVVVAPIMEAEQAVVSEPNDKPKFLCVSIAQGASDHEDQGKRVSQLMFRYKADVVFLLCADRAAALISAASISANRSSYAASYRMLFMKDLCPFLHHSELVVLHRETDRVMADVLERIEQLFTGNFDFLSMAESNVTLASANQSKDKRIEKLESELAETRAALSTSELALAEARAVLNTTSYASARRGEKAPAHEASDLIRSIYRGVLPQSLRTKIFAVRQILSDRRKRRG